MDFDELIPLSKAAERLGMSYSELEKLIEDNDMEEEGYNEYCNGITHEDFEKLKIIISSKKAAKVPFWGDDEPEPEAEEPAQETTPAPESKLHKDAVTPTQSVRFHPANPISNPMKAIHPLCKLFPMLPEEELDALAEDIKRTKQRERIKVWHGLIIDGQNRQEACKRANKVPLYEDFDGTEDQVKAYIISKNVERRHLTKNQQTLAYAVIYPGLSKGGRGNLNHVNPTQSVRFHPTKLSEARKIVKQTPDLIPDVMSGAMTFSAALAKGEERNPKPKPKPKKQKVITATQTEFEEKGIEGIKEAHQLSPPNSASADQLNGASQDVKLDGIGTVHTQPSEPPMLEQVQTQTPKPQVLTAAMKEQILAEALLIIEAFGQKEWNGIVKDAKTEIGKMQ